MNILSRENVINRITELEDDTDYQIKIMKDINNSGLLSFIWYNLTGKFKKAQLKAEDNINKARTLLDYLTEML
jgi:hypothetical protein